MRIRLAVALVVACSVGVVPSPAPAWRAERIQSLVCQRLAYQLQSKDPSTRKSAAATVASMGPAAASTIPTLRKALATDPDPEVRAAVARALGSMGAKAQAAQPSLLQALGEDQQAQVRIAAVEAVLLVSRRQGVSPVQKALREDRDSGVRTAAATALAGLGPSAVVAQSALEEGLLKDADPAVRSAAALALIGIGPRAAGSLVKGLRRGDPETRRVAAKALGKLQAPPTEVIVSLVEVCADKEVGVRLAAARSLGEHGAKSARGVLPLQNLLLKDPDDGVRAAAATALGKIGPRAAALALKALHTAAQGDPSPAVREAAQQALARLRGAARGRALASR